MVGRVLPIFLASRVVTTHHPARLRRAPARGDRAGSAAPDYFEFATIWDGHWYWLINAVGYPVELPVDDAGHVGRERLGVHARLPVPAAALHVARHPVPGHRPARLDGVRVSGRRCCSTGCMARFLPSGSALFARRAVLLRAALADPAGGVRRVDARSSCCSPRCCCCVERRYWLLIPVVVRHVAHAAERPRVRALPAAAPHPSLRGAARGSRSRRASAWSRHRRRALSALAGLAWPRSPGRSTGIADGLHRHRTGVACRRTSATRSSCRSRPGPRAPSSGSASSGCRAGWDLVLGARSCGARSRFAVFLFTPWARRLGVDLRFWLASYALYLLAVFFPQSSTFRLLMPLAPGARCARRAAIRCYRGSLVRARRSPVRSAGCYDRVVDQRVRLVAAVARHRRGRSAA